MVYITCEHPIEQIRVVWHISKQTNSYKVTTPHAHCIECNSNLPDTDTQAKMAIDLVMLDVARRADERWLNDVKEDEEESAD